MLGELTKQGIPLGLPSVRMLCLTVVHKTSSKRPEQRTTNPDQQTPNNDHRTTMYDRTQINIPMIVALSSEASVPPSSARKPNSLSQARLLGASEPMPPIWMPMLAKFAKPQSI